MADNDWLKTPLELAGKTVWLAGHNGLVGSAVSNALKDEGCSVLTENSHALDLRDQAATLAFLEKKQPDIVICAAGHVGGIAANMESPGRFFYDNMMIALNVIHSAYKTGISRLLYLGSACIYPKDAPSPLSEEALLSGAFEPSNEAYALAKSAGIRMCQYYRRDYGSDFMSAIPCNLYGPHDHFGQQSAHVIPMLMDKYHKAIERKETAIEIWGTGHAKREFLYSQDLAEALIFLLRHYKGDAPVNVGSDTETSIAELARMMCEITGYKGELVFNPDKPEGAKRRLLNSSRIHKAGWRAKTPLHLGLEDTYQWYLKNHEKLYAA